MVGSSRSDELREWRWCVRCGDLERWRSPPRYIYSLDYIHLLVVVLGLLDSRGSGVNVNEKLCCPCVDVGTIVDVGATNDHQPTQKLNSAAICSSSSRNDVARHDVDVAQRNVG